MDRGSEKTLFQRRHTSGQQVRENVLNITNHEGNTGQNYNEITPNISRIAVTKKTGDKKCWWARMWREGSLCILLVGIQTGTATMENSVEVP